MESSYSANRLRTSRRPRRPSRTSPLRGLQSLADDAERARYGLVLPRAKPPNLERSRRGPQEDVEHLADLAPILFAAIFGEVGELVVELLAR
jgi:hypothetical protein